MTLRIRSATTVITLLLIAVGLPAAAQPPVPAAVPGVDEALKPVKSRFAPDRRLAVFDIKTTMQDGVLTVEGEVESDAARQAALEALRGAGFAQIVDRLSVLPDPKLGARRFGIVRVSVANVKGKPSHGSDMVTQTVAGWTVRVLGTASGWHYVHTDPDGYLGWIEDLQLTLVDEAGRSAWVKGSRAIVTAQFALALEKPSAASTPVSDLVMGSLVRLLARDGDWLSIELADGRRGYVPAGHAQPYDAWRASVTPTPDGVERTALRFMGVPYLWGGTSSKGFDCSGFSKTVFRMNGVELSRDTDQQAQEGAAVATDDEFAALRKGDLLFFGATATADRPERITHVGIYVGNGEFLHASGLVRRNSLLPASPIYSESLRARLVRVQRVLP